MGAGFLLPPNPPGMRTPLCAPCPGSFRCPGSVRSSLSCFLLCRTCCCSSPRVVCSERVSAALALSLLFISSLCLPLSFFLCPALSPALIGCRGERGECSRPLLVPQTLCSCCGGNELLCSRATSRSSEAPYTQTHTDTHICEVKTVPR